PSQEGAALELQSNWNANLFWALPRQTPGVFARHCSFPQMQLRRDIGWRAYYCSPCGEGGLRLEDCLAQLSAAIQPRAWTRSVSSAEDVVMLKPLFKRRSP